MTQQYLPYFYRLASRYVLGYRCVREGGGLRGRIRLSDILASNCRQEEPNTYHEA